MEDYVIEKNGRKRKAERVICNNCNISFLKQIRFIKENNYCCKECSWLGNTSETITVICSFCGIEFEKKKYKLKGSKSGYYFCCRECKNNALKKENWNNETYNYAPDHYGNSNGKGSYRRIAMEYYDNKCEKCGYNDHIEILQVHHIDSNRENNNIENLIILCPNCHWSITLKYVNINENRSFIENW